MANCTKCGTWNPDDRNICWRCSEELPKPQPKKPPPRTFGGLPTWTWILLGVMVVIWLATTFLTVGGAR